MRTAGQRGLRREGKEASACAYQEIVRGSNASIRMPSAHWITAIPFELLVATILSAQCTGRASQPGHARIVQALPDGGRHGRCTHRRAGRADQIQLAFSGTRPRACSGCRTPWSIRHNGVVPDEMDALVDLPGVGRKTANVLLGNAFHKDEGIVVDTHVTRLSGRLGLTAQTDARENRAGSDAARSAR